MSSGRACGLPYQRWYSSGSLSRKSALRSISFGASAWNDSMRSMACPWDRQRNSTSHGFNSSIRQNRSCVRFRRLGWALNTNFPAKRSEVISHTPPPRDATAAGAGARRRCSRTPPRWRPSAYPPRLVSCLTNMSCLTNKFTHLLVLLAVGCVAPLPVVSVGTGGFETRPYKSSCLHDGEIPRNPACESGHSGGMRPPSSGACAAGGV